MMNDDGLRARVCRHRAEVLFEIYFSKVLSPKRAKVGFCDFQRKRLENRRENRKKPFLEV